MSTPASTSVQSLYIRGILLAAAGMFVISPDGMLIHMAQTSPVWDILFWRTFGMGVSLFLMLAAVYRRRLFTMLKGQGKLGLLSGCLLAVSNFLFVAAMLNTSVANTLVILATMPFWSAILGLLLIGEAVRRRTWVAIAVALVGIVIIVSGSIGGGALIGDMYALGAALAHGLNLVVLRRAGDKDMTASLMLSGFITAAVCLPFLQPSAVPVEDWWILGLLGFVILPVALTLFLSGARYAPAAEVALLSLVETVLGPMWAWAFLGDAPSTVAFIGGGLVVAAVAGNALAGVVARRRRGISPAEAVMAEKGPEVEPPNV